MVDRSPHLPPSSVPFPRVSSWLQGVPGVLGPGATGLQRSWVPPRVSVPNMGGWGASGLGPKGFWESVRLLPGAVVGTLGS